MNLSLIPAFFLLVVGFILLIKGADYFVEGSANVAKQFHVPTLIIGMTIVAMGTSLPECSVSVNASLNGENSLAVSNALGSNMFNLMIVCGVCALFVPLAVQADTLKKDFPFSVLCTLLLLVLGYAGMVLSRFDGIVLLLVFVGFILYMIKSAQNAKMETIKSMDSREQNSSTEMEPSDSMEPSGSTESKPSMESSDSMGKNILFIVLGAAAIAGGGELVVRYASQIALAFGMTQTLVGLTICAIGTSLPELVTSLVAARKNEVDMALGNVIGSNIFNILFVLGIGASISPIAFISENIVDIIVLIAMSLLVFVFTWSQKKITRMEGIVMILIYIIYWFYICIR